MKKFQNVVCFDLLLQYKSEQSDDLIPNRSFKTYFVLIYFFNINPSAAMILSLPELSNRPESG
ncbi:TPA: hypothetical protein NR472_001912 [Listeria innocua]|nr:hypothetical protein [Listeria innocua]